MRLSDQNKTDISEFIAEEFGANATYVKSLLERFRSNPALVDDSWRSYFNELVQNGDGSSPVTGNGSSTATGDGRSGASVTVVTSQTNTNSAPAVTATAVTPERA